jgi:hypothetical protein
MVFPTEGMMHPHAGPSFNSLARASHGAMESIAELSEEVDTFQRRASTVSASTVTASPRLSLSEPLDALNYENGEDARGFACHVAEDVGKFKRRASPVTTSPVSTSPRLSLSGWLDALNNESGEDAGGHDAIVSSSAAASGKEDVACSDKNQAYTGCVREKLSDLGTDVVA